MRRRRSPILLIFILLSLLPRLVAGQESWLDSQQRDWNRPGIAIPAAPAPVAADSAYCQTLVRPVETAVDAALVAQGWRLFSAYQRGWGITLTGGFVDFDAMCRPVSYQEFVFVDGRFAGTLAPVPMAPRSDGALTDARITSANHLIATYMRYAPTDPLCCPSDKTVITFSIARTTSGPVVTPDVEPSPATPAALPAAETSAVCVNLGTGDTLTLTSWTDEQIAAYEADAGTVGRPDPATGTCTDLAGLPVLRDFLGGFSWVCSRTADARWYGPVWTARLYRAATDVPPNPDVGGCPQPRNASFTPPPAEEQAAATAVYLSQLATGDLTSLYAWLHPDAQAVIPETVVVGWYAAEWLPLGPEPIVVRTVEFGSWTWGVTGATYADAATITFEQSFADGTVAGSVTHLVRDDQGVWRWFFGSDAAFVTAQRERFAPQRSGGRMLPADFIQTSTGLLRQRS
jgi:hypothetical protein